MKIWITTTIIFLLMPYLSLAAGSIKLDGKVRSFSKENIEISDYSNIYIIDKKRLSKQQLKSIEAVKVGNNTKLMISFDAIVDVRTIK